MAEDGNGNRSQLRALSKTLLGSRYQAEVGAAIADSKEPIWGEGLLGTLGERPPAKGLMGKELERLREAKLLIPAGENPHDRRKLLKPADPNGSYWKLCKELRRMAGSTHQDLELADEPRVRESSA
jgi:hypothetical protein